MITKIEKFRTSLINLERSPHTVKSYTIFLKSYNRWLETNLNGPATMVDITTSNINAYLLYLKEERNNVAASRARAASAIKSFLLWAYKEGHISESLAQDVPSIKVPQKEHRFLSPEEVKVWIDEVDDNLIKVSMWMMYYAGLRISEATNLLLKDVILQGAGGWLKIHNAKGGRFRRVPIAPPLAVVLSDYMSWRVESEKFLATRRTKELRPGTIQIKLQEVRERLGWSSDITPHVLRHSFATEVYSKSKDILSVSKLLGHSDLSTTMIYAHLHDDDMLNAVNMLE